MSQGTRLVATEQPPRHSPLRWWNDRCGGGVLFGAASMFLALVGVPGQGAAHHMQARIVTPASVPCLPDDVEVIGRKGQIVWVTADPATVARLRDSGFSVTVEIENMEAFYAAGIRGPTWGIYHTLAETEVFLDSLHRARPTITSAPFSLGMTHEGRPIWAMKISDNPTVDEEEPEVLIDGLHHAREVMSVETVLDLAGWLCAAYPENPVARAMVDHREVFMVPVVNPDGMAHNEATYPSGGGMWRKNRRDNGNGTFGVDLNRNYPFQWGRDDGSSPDPGSTIYRGPSPASEPETQAMISFMSSRRFGTHLSMHSFLGSILIPWGYTAAPTPDDALLRAWGRRMSTLNSYAVAQPPEVLYPCSGMMLDWAYGEAQTKNAIISTTIEIGGSGFWPAESEVPGLIEECRWPLQYVVQSAGVWLATTGWDIGGGNGDWRLDPGETVDVAFRIENRAVLADASPAVLTVRTDDAYLEMRDVTAVVPALAAGDTTSTEDVISFTVDPAAPQGHIAVLYPYFATEGFSGEEAVRLVVGTPPGLFFDDFSQGIGAWESGGTWGVTAEDAYSPTMSLTDSPGGDYDNYSDSWIRLAQPLDLSAVSIATLSFWHRFDTEESYDHCVVEASADGGMTWHQVGPQYSGAMRTWEPVELPLDEWVGSPAFTVRYRLETDVSITADGWYIDDVLIAGPTGGNTPPAPPCPVSPPDEAVVDGPAPTLAVSTLPDPDGDALTCGFILYADSLFTTRLAASQAISVVDGMTSWTTPPLADGIYWWRVYAYDGTERGPLSPGSSFRVGPVSAAVLPSLTALQFQCTPNPCPGAATMEFLLPAPTRARLALHDLAGRQMKLLADADFPVGRNRVFWNGDDARGTPVPPGVYVARLETGGEAAERFVIVTR